MKPIEILFYLSQKNLKSAIGILIKLILVITNLLNIVNMLVCIENMYVPGKFIKSHFNSIYTKEELDALKDEDLYNVQYFEPIKDDKYTVRLSIPKINDYVVTIVFNRKISMDLHYALMSIWK